MNRHPIQRIVRRSPAQALVVLATVLTAQSVAALEGDTLNFSVGSNLQYNSNVYRTPDTAGPQPGYSTKADYFSVSHVDVNFDKAYSMQRLQFGGSYSVTRYDTFTKLNADTLNYQGAWRWALTPKLTGSLNASQTQAQVPFTDISGTTQRNLRTTTNQSLNLDAQVSGKWHLLAGIGRSESETEQTILATPSYRSRHWEGGLRYMSAPGNSITLNYRETPAELVNSPLDPVNLVDTNYLDTEAEVKVNWQLNGHSDVNGRLARISRRNEHFPQRDFSGLAGDLGYIWKVGDKLQFNLTASRNILPFVAFGNIVQNSTYKVDQQINLVSTWRPGANTTVSLSISHTHSDYRGPVFAITGPARNDDARNVQFGANWRITRYLSVNASVGRDSRSSNLAQFQFTNNAASIGVEAKF